jgi:hypothetical protein
MTAEAVQSVLLMPKRSTGCLRTWVFILLATISANCVDRAHFDELNRQTGDFAKKQDWKSMQSVLEEMGHELPGFPPVYMLRRASVAGHLGQRAEALAWLKRYAATGLSFDLGSAGGLKQFLSDNSFQQVAAEMRDGAKPVTRAEVVCSLPLDDLMPEDITYDGSTDTFIVSSIQHRGIYRVSLPSHGAKECTLKEIPLEENARRWPVLAVSYDRGRNLVWLTSCALSGFHGFSDADSGKAALFAADPTTGKVVRRLELEGKQTAELGDMFISEDGTVFVSDGDGGGVYRVRGDIRSAHLEQIADGLFSPQTPVLAKDGKRLFVADYSLGIGIVDLSKSAPRNTTYLRHPANVAVVGLDGLYLSGNSLIGIQNGTQPERIIRYQLNSFQTEITGAEVIEQGPRLGEPTHATRANGSFYFLANVGWDKVDDHGELKAGAHFTAPLLLRYRFGPPV